jgi:uncharacterized protein YaiI (UPF0178 family)
MIMQIWVDADACPKIIKDILLRAAERTKTLIIFVSNQLLILPSSQYISKVKVSSGFDVADNYIVKHMEQGDLIITADIPLADAVIDKDGVALNPRGELYSQSNIKQRLSIRDFATHLRDTGVHTGGPNKISKSEIQAFANYLDKYLTKGK